MTKQFMDFLKNYNVIGMAIAVVIGGKLNTFVNSLIQDLVMPVIFAPALKAANVEKISELNYNGIIYGKVIGTAIEFLIVAIIVFIFAKIVLKEETVSKK